MSEIIARMTTSMGVRCAKRNKELYLAMKWWSVVHGEVDGFVDDHGQNYVANGKIVPDLAQGRPGAPRGGASRVNTRVARLHR